MRSAPKLAAVATAAAMLLASCSSSTDGDASAATPPLEATPTPEVEDTATPEPEPTPEVIDAEPGDVVTEEEAELLPEGQTAYELQDGSLVVVGDEEPLPEPVVNDIVAEGNVIGEDAWTTSDGDGARRLADFVKQKQREVGRGIYRVNPVYGYRTPEDAYAERPTHYWFTSAVRGPDGLYDTMEGAVAATEAVVAEEGSNKSIIVFGN